jgi:hypothetical protein
MSSRKNIRKKSKRKPPLKRTKATLSHWRNLFPSILPTHHQMWKREREMLKQENMLELVEERNMIWRWRWRWRWRWTTRLWIVESAYIRHCTSILLLFLRHTLPLLQTGWPHKLHRFLCSLLIPLPLPLPHYPKCIFPIHHLNPCCENLILLNLILFLLPFLRMLLFPHGF